MTTDNDFSTKHQETLSETPVGYDPSTFFTKGPLPDATASVPLIVSVKVSKPKDVGFVRVHPGAEWRQQVYLLKNKSDEKRGENFHLLHPSLVDHFPNEAVFASLFTSITRAGVVGIWPIILPDKEGEWNEAHQAQFEAAKAAMTRWVKISWNKSTRRYDVRDATGDSYKSDPDWAAALGELNLVKLVEIGFRGKMITSLDHPFVQKLFGED